MDAGMILEWVIVGRDGADADRRLALRTLFERKVIARIQVRVGQPGRSAGVLQPIADGQTDLQGRADPGADKKIFILAPLITVLPALTVLAVVPLGPPLPCSAARSTCS